MSFLSFRRRPQPLYIVETFYGAQNGWITRSCRDAAGAERFAALLGRIDSRRNHRVVSAEVAA